MELVSAFKLSLYGLTALAAWMLGRAEGGWIPYATFPVLAAAFAITEPRGGRSLPAWLANFFGAFAVSAAGWEFSLPGQEAKLLSGAHLLVYATWIVMFQEKTYRLYWWVMALGVLQVAVASVLQPEAWYGFFLVFYISAALATMTIAALFQVQQQFVEGDNSWKWEAPRESGGAAAVLVRPTVQFDETHGWLTRQFFGGLTVLIAMSLSVSLAFFVLTPRIWVGPRNLLGDETTEATERRKSRTGFASEVKLGEMGEILESIKPVFSVQCRDAKTGVAVPLTQVAERLGMEEPLFRGAVMTEYKDGRWYPERQDHLSKISRIFNGSGYVEEFTLEATSDELLFCMGNAEAIEIAGLREDAYVQMSTGIVSRELRPDAKQRLTYSTYVRPLEEELRLLRASPLPSWLRFQRADLNYLRRTQFMDDSQLPRLADLARKRLADLKLRSGPNLKVIDVCRDFESYFTASGEFGYTLNLTIKDQQIDPIEDFLFNRKEGHCEYFASALTLMLRAVGVPARLVSGFKGAQLNGLRGTWEVQERHAHAWVEAWTENDVWVTLDPTPSLERNETMEDVSAKIGLWGRLRSSTTMLWQDYVVGVNLRQQQVGVYGPIREFFAKLLALGRRWTQSWPELWRHFLYILTHPAEWLSVTGGLVTFASLVTLALLLGGAWRFVRWVRSGGWRRWWSGDFQERLVVLFYERFLTIVKQAGLRREPTQTPREFAESVGPRLRVLAKGPALEELPQRVSSAFYRVRFGGETLPSSELEWIDAQLSLLEATVSSKPR